MEKLLKMKKDKTAIKFFGDTEEQILKDWLAYFSSFDSFESNSIPIYNNAP